MPLDTGSPEVTDQPLQAGSLPCDGLDQTDLTGPFEVLSGLPGVTRRLGAAH